MDYYTFKTQLREVLKMLEVQIDIFMAGSINGS